MASSSAELRALYEADQADRSSDQLGPSVVDRDRARSGAKTWLVGAALPIDDAIRIAASLPEAISP